MLNPKKITVMKQRIFSLLFLMTIATLGAWAAGTYTVKKTMGTFTQDDTGIGLPKTYSESDIADVVKGAYPAYNDANYRVIFTKILADASYTELAVSGDGIELKAPFKYTAKYFLDVTIEKNDGGSWVTETTLTPVLQFDLYHETHTFDVAWTYNTTDHWHNCTIADSKCTATDGEKSKAAHIFDDGATDATYYTCSVCGYIDGDRKSVIVKHVHKFAATWEENDTHHWHQCTVFGCSLDYNNLTADQKTAASYGVHEYGVSSEGDAYHTCKVCGHIDATRQGETTAHTHSYGSWLWDKSQHWKACENTVGGCSAPKSDNAAHTYGSTGADRWTCSVCGYTSPERETAAKNADEAAKTLSWGWDYEIPFDFNTTSVKNDRKMNSEQYYTTFLPYDLKLKNMKIFYIEQSSDKLVGFKEQSISQLPALQAAVVLAETTSTPLSCGETKVHKTIDITDRGAIEGAHTGSDKHTIFGSLKYLKEGDAEDLYIMQGATTEFPMGTFKQITDNQGAYDNADMEKRYCVLPMRAYLKASAAPSREILGVQIHGLDGSTTAVERLIIDADDEVKIFDLQGRQVKSPRKGGLYIINGKKQIF